jgi:hypothetical protein
MIKKVFDLHVKNPLFLSDFHENWIFLSDFRKKYSNNKFRENPSSWRRVCFMRTDGRTDITKLIVAFRDFANAPQNDHGSTLSTPHAHTPCPRITAPWHCSTSGQQQRTLREGRPAAVSCSVTQLCGRQAAARGTFREIFIKDNCLVFSAFSLTETNLNSFITIHKQT